ncbi:MAG TPA: hypothetical protein VG755_21530 [Nannocystaceae bacterium]|nr:hypothetical protein [Nannocystaceae bacterium]
MKREETVREAGAPSGWWSRAFAVVVGVVTVVLGLRLRALARGDRLPALAHPSLG